MSAVSREAGGSNQDFELNIAPIIDCFTVLITYLLVSASFLTLNILDIGVAASGVAPTPAETQPQAPPVSFAITLDAQRVITLKVTGGPRNLDLSYPVPGGPNGAWNIAGAVAKVSEAMRYWPDVREISVTADPTIRYREIIHLLDPLKKLMPKVYLAGS